MFAPVAIETTGVFGPNAMQLFLREIGHPSPVCCNGEQRSYSFLLQRLTVAAQRGNAASVSGTPVSSDSVYYYVSVFNRMLFLYAYYILW